jgi:hypothetical protein
VHQLDEACTENRNFQQDARSCRFVFNRPLTSWSPDESVEECFSEPAAAQDPSSNFGTNPSKRAIDATLALEHQAQSSLLDADAFGVEKGIDGHGRSDPGTEQLNFDAGSGDC